MPVDPESGLGGRTILTTRAAGQAAALGQELEALGATVVEIPTIELVPPESWDPVDDAIRHLPAYDWIIFTSANAVDAFMDRAGALPEIQVAVVGRQTSARLRERRVDADLVPEEFRAEGLLEHFPADLTGMRILFPRAEAADETLPETLRARGATVEVIAVYRTRAPASGGEELRRLLNERAIDCVTLTSGSTVRNLVEMIGADDAVALLSHPAIAVIGPVTRAAAEGAGLKVRIEPESATIPGLVEAIRRHFEQSVELESGSQ